MAVNDERSMNADFRQGVVDRSYIQLTPDRGGVENPPSDRMSWPTYRAAEQHADDSHLEAEFVQSQRPSEQWRGDGVGDRRF